MGVSTESQVHLKFGKLERLCNVGNAYSCVHYAAHERLPTVAVGLRCKSIQCVELTGQINQTIQTYFVSYLCTESCWLQLLCFCSIMRSSNLSLVQQLTWQTRLTDIVMRLLLLWTHMLGCPLIICSFLQTSLRSLPPTILVFLRSLTRLILLLFIFCCPLVGRYMMFFTYHN